MTSWEPKVLVVGTDGSEGSIRAATVGAAMARVHNASLHFVTVVRPPEGWWGVVGSPPSAESLAAAMATAQRDSLDAATAAVDLEGLEWYTAEEIGDPAHELLAYATRLNADAVLVGKRGAGIIERIVVGSVADQVVHEADVPVVVVP